MGIFSLISHWQRWRSSKHLVSLFHDHGVFCFVSRPLVHWPSIFLDCDLRSSPWAKPWLSRAERYVRPSQGTERRSRGVDVDVVLMWFLMFLQRTWELEMRSSSSFNCSVLESLWLGSDDMMWHVCHETWRDMACHSWCWVTIFQISSCAHVQRSWSWMNCFKKDMAWDHVGLLSFACYLCSWWSSLLVMLDTAIHSNQSIPINGSWKQARKQNIISYAICAQTIK